MNLDASDRFQCALPSHCPDDAPYGLDSIVEFGKSGGIDLRSNRGGALVGTGNPKSAKYGAVNRRNDVGRLIGDDVGLGPWRVVA
jgi:hypothetical protein